MPKPEVIFLHNPKMYNTKFEQVNAFLDNCKYELADSNMYYKIKQEREEFVNWLKNQDLLWLMDNPTEQKSRVHWDNYLSVLHIFIRFDLTLAQCPCPNFEEDEILYRKEQRFKNIITALNEVN